MHLQKNTLLFASEQILTYVNINEINNSWNLDNMLSLANARIMVAN